ncbi:hypothetical protein J3E61_006943 [Mycobacterium sp. OAE908]|uniref:hypothetical protein n=1 Tax=Mycobacterium sp. OAE908 TaxID=2817899 RepID=UPI0034E2478C
MTLLVSIGIEAPTAASSADDALHHVKYVLWAESPVHAEIYYRDTDPPTFAAYSHNPYEFSPKVEADVGPDKHWVLDVMLADPNQWAMVVGLVPLANSDHNFHCALAIDGTVVFTNAGPKGALCSLRHW